MILTIVSIGPGDPALLNEKSIETIRQAGMLFLRTGRHPFVKWLEQQRIPFFTMDDLYESSDDFEALSHAVAAKLWKAAGSKENTVYAVSDTMTDHTVDEIFSLRPENARIRMIPGFSFADYYLPICREFFSTADIRICPASSFNARGYDPAKPVLITELNDFITAGEIKNILSASVRDEEKIVFLNGDASPRLIPLFELDRQPSYDHLSAVAAGSFPYASRSRKTLEDLMQIMDRLRSPSGCPWDRVQTHETLRPYVIEEAWEVVDAIQQNDPDHLAEELGDLLFQVVFHASIGKSFDEFSIDDVVGAICEKMIRRHPHVFREDGSAADRTDIAFSVETWDKIKQAETGSKTPAGTLLDVSEALPSLRYAEKVLRKLDRFPGFEYPSDEKLLSAFSETIVRLKDGSDRTGMEKRLGSLLFCCSEIARRFDLDSEVILHQTVRRVIRSCQTLENEGKNGSESLKPLTFNDLGVY